MKKPRDKGKEVSDGRRRAPVQCLLISGVTLLLLFVLILVSVTPEQYEIHVGRPADITIYATRDVEDTVTTEKLRQAAADAVEPVYKSVDHGVDPGVLSDMSDAIQQLLSLCSEYATDKNPDEKMLASFNQRSPVELSLEELSGLLTTDISVLEQLGSACLDEVRETLNTTLPERQEGTAVTRISRDLIDQKYNSQAVSAFTDLLREYLRPNMLIDTEITEENRQRARDEVEPEMLVKREVIVRQGEIVTEAQYQMIASLGLLADDAPDLPLMGGLLLITLSFGALIAFYLHQFRPVMLTDPKQLLLMCLILILEVCLSMLVRGINVYLMPVALASMLLTTLIDTRVALFVNTVLSFIVSLLVSADGLFSMQMFAVMLITFAAGPVASLVLSHQPLRSGVLLAGFAVSVTNFLLVLGVGLINSVNIHDALQSALWSMGGAILSAVLAIGLQALLEWLFNLATNARLIELSNPNQPLLRRLLMEAPGTYHHSIIVANLAEAATEEIGGNGLLARVGAYYHDIGKLKRPTYFKENQIGANNPHDRADPRVSAAILTAHPRDGAQMAIKAKLPTEVVDIVRQHHGDSMALYFYDKANKLYGDNNMDSSVFRYAGPRPRTKEAAVVMLADTIEAATRTLTDPSPERLQEMIRKLVQAKLDDGQLNESPLTFNDLDRICVTFCTVLTGVFHTRIEYPDVPIPPRQGKALPEGMAYDVYADHLEAKHDDAATETQATSIETAETRSGTDENPRFPQPETVTPDSSVIIGNSEEDGDVD